jgi:hypothetical protein
MSGEMAAMASMPPLLGLAGWKGRREKGKVGRGGMAPQF